MNTKNTFTYIFAFISALLVFSTACDKSTADPVDSLSNYISEQENGLIKGDTIIACAIGGETYGSATNTGPISVFLYAFAPFEELKYFEQSTTGQSERDNSTYIEQEIEEVSLFQGKMYRIDRSYAADKKWCRVTFKVNGNLYSCNPIFLDAIDRPSAVQPEWIEIDSKKKTEPLFSWKTDTNPQNIIYFQLIADSQKTFLSGTYTEDKYFQFYDTKNVVLNLNSVENPPGLLENEDYQFVLMGVGHDNWVNLFVDIPFTTR